MQLDNIKQIFNLWNTNGRRSDILNAIDIYLKCLQEVQEEYPNDGWTTYPKSLQQYRFYQKAIEASPEVFKKHDNYDAFISAVSDEDLVQRKVLSKELMKSLDTDIEQRARHYTSNLCRLGFATEERNITPAGLAYMSNTIQNDEIENLLPIDTTNLLLLRQLVKFRTYTKPDENGKRMSYSPLFMALYLLLSDYRFDNNNFKTIVQSLSPYSPVDPDEIMQMVKENDFSFLEKEFEIPDEFCIEGVVGQDAFEQNIKNKKSSSTANIVYYEFYKKLYDYYHDRSPLRFAMLKEACSDGSDMLKQAFGNGQKVFDFGRQNAYEHEEFIEANSNSPFLNTEHFNKTFYSEYWLSKVSDQARENSDTTTRLLSASGLISFGRALPELANADIYKIVFNKDYLKSQIFKEVDDVAFCQQERKFLSNVSLCEILGYDERQVTEIIEQISHVLGSSKDDLKSVLRDRVASDFNEHIKNNYPRDKVIKLLAGFNDPDQGAGSRDIVNKACSIPTAYEYVVGIAWYYISNKEYNLYESLNLTMGADFEPERFAPGGAGDIVATYDDLIVMLEVTMMNPQAQKRGEWEPVLRHAVNMCVSAAPKPTITFFVSNYLDYNTINIWRAVATVPLQSSNSNEIVKGVRIMPITTLEMVKILENNVESEKLISITNASYDSLNSDFNDEWREEILDELFE